MQSPQFRELRVSDLKSAHYNPPGRTKKDRVRDLVHSIGKVGLLYPVLVTKDNVIIDGHRRVVAYKELGLETIPAIIGAGDPSELYASVNATSRKMSGNESLVVYLKEPMAVSPMLKARMDLMVNVLGEARVKRIAKEGMSIRIYNRANSVARYCEQDESNIPEIVDWLMNTQNTQTIVQAMTHQISPTTILRAMRSNKALRFKAVVSQ